MASPASGLARRWPLALLVLLAPPAVAALVLGLAPPLDGAPLPPPSLAPRLPYAFDSAMGPFTTVGAVHVHTSDHSGDAHASLQRVLEAAVEAQLGFLVVTDHDHPADADAGEPQAMWHHGMLVLRGVEWSLDDGHLLDLAPGRGRGPFARSVDAVADCRARGGPCVAAHPHAWRRQWLGSHLGLDGMEVHSAMAALGDRVEPPFVSVGWLAFQLLVAPGLPMLDVGARQERAAQMFLANAQAVPGYAAFCGSDVHGNVPLVPNLRAFATLVALQHPWSANADEAAAQLRSALTRSSACVNQTAGNVEGMALQSVGPTVRAAVDVGTDVLGTWEAVLRRDGVEVARAKVVPGKTARLEVPAARGTLELQVVATVALPWGPLTRVMGVRFLRVEDVPQDENHDKNDDDDTDALRGNTPRPAP